MHRQALQLNPGSPFALHFSAANSLFRGDLDGAQAGLEQHRQLVAPTGQHLFVNSAVSLMHLLGGDYEKVVHMSRAVLHLNPGFISRILRRWVTSGCLPKRNWLVHGYRRWIRPSQSKCFSLGHCSGAFRTATKDAWHGIESGDVLLGYANAYGDPAPGPYVQDDLAGRSAGLVQGAAPEGHLDLGLNGSYLVVRELQQDVAGFWNDMARCAAAANVASSSSAQISADWLAERVIGRDLGCGDLLLPPPEPGAAASTASNATGFFETDRYGDGCPLGAHVRRANPRDGLAGAPEFTRPVLEGANNHRLLRRGRKYGSKSADRHVFDGEERGLLFMCLNTDIARQFEFVQQSWLLNPNFAVLNNQTDPLLGPPGPFTIPQTPLRRQLGLGNHVRLAGGDYFFFPSIPVLSYLADSSWSAVQN